MLISFFLTTIISTSLTAPGQPSPRFHVKAWLPFRNCEMNHWLNVIIVVSLSYLVDFCIFLYFSYILSLY